MNDQPQPKRPILKDVVPVLAVKDLPASLNYYQKILGFEVAWEWGEPPSMASVCRDSVEFNLALRDDQEFSPSSVYVVVEEIDLLYQTWLAHGLEIRTEIADQSYGMRDFDFLDPSGNVICVGESIVS